MPIRRTNKKPSVPYKGTKGYRFFRGTTQIGIAPDSSCTAYAIHVSLLTVEIHRHSLLVSVQDASPESIPFVDTYRVPTAAGSL